jgi:integrase
MDNAPNAGADAKAARAPIDTQIDAWIADKAREARCAQGVHKARTIVERLAAAHGWTDAKQATTPQIREWLGQLRAGTLDWQQVKGKRRKTTPAGAARTGKRHNNVLTTIRTFFDFCTENPSREKPWVRSNPCASIRKVPEHDSDDGSRAFTTVELKRLMATAGKPKRENDRRCTIDRKFVYMAAALLGVRWSTLRRLTWGMIDTGAKEVRFPRSTHKKGRKTHVVPMAPELVACLDYWRARQSAAGVPTGLTDRVFPKMPSPHSLDRDVARANIEALTAKGAIGWHSFRKWWMTRVASKAEAPVLHVLAGHESMQTTMRSYVDPDQVLGEDGVGKSVMESMPCLNGTYPPASSTPVLELPTEDLTRGQTPGKLEVPQPPMCYAPTHHDSTEAAHPGTRAVEELNAPGGRLSPSRGVETAQNARESEPGQNGAGGSRTPVLDLDDAGQSSRAEIASTLARIAQAHTEFLRVQGRGLELLRAYSSGSLPCPPSTSHPV